MTAVDTNVVVRLLVEDDPEQTEIARRVFASGPIWVAKTVLLETAWVLRSGLRWDELSIRDYLVKLVGLPYVQVEDEPAVTHALALVDHGVDFADALHLSSPPGAHFVSFDRSLVRRAQRAGAANISEPA
jgi:predicted nucleic-acid-binding protein